MCGSALATLASCLWTIDNSATVTVKSLTVFVSQDILVLLQWKTGQLLVNCTWKQCQIVFLLLNVKSWCPFQSHQRGPRRVKKILCDDFQLIGPHHEHMSINGHYLYLYFYSELNRLYWHTVPRFNHWLMFAIEMDLQYDQWILSLSAQKKLLFWYKWIRYYSIALVAGGQFPQLFKTESVPAWRIWDRGWQYSIWLLEIDRMFGPRMAVDCCHLRVQCYQSLRKMVLVAP